MATRRAPGRARASLASVAAVAIASILVTSCGSSATPAPTAAPQVTAAPTTAATTAATAGASAAPTSAAPAFTPPNLKGKKFNLLFASGANMAKVPTAYALELMRSWGATTTINYVDSQSVGMAAVLSGDADVVDGGPSDAIDAVQAGGDVVAFALTVPRYDYIFTCKPSITALSQLKGATIGVVDTTGTNLQQAILVMQKAGLTIKDATLIVTGGQSKRVAALIAGRTDCTIVGYLNYLKVADQGYTNLFNFMSDAPDLYYTTAYTTKGWLTANHDMAVAFNEALLLAHRWASDKANKDQLTQLTLEVVPGSDPAAVGKSFDAWLAGGMFGGDAIMTDAALTKQMDELVAIGAYKTALTTGQYADLTPGQEALAAVGAKQ